MRKTVKTRRIPDETEIDGPMMLYKPMTKTETAKVTAWVTKRKAEIAAGKKSKSQD